MVHFHSAVDQHVVPEVWADQQARDQTGGEEAVQRVAAGESVESRPAEPEAAAHLGAILCLTDLMDQAAEGDGNSLEPDTPQDHGGGPAFREACRTREDL